MTSCMILSFASESVRAPMRLAGTCRRYSNSAMPQLTKAAAHHGRLAMLRRWAYHAKVMKTLDATSRRTVTSGERIALDYGSIDGLTMLAPPKAGSASTV